MEVFWKIQLEGAIELLISLNGPFEKKFGNPGIDLNVKKNLKQL